MKLRFLISAIALVIAHAPAWAQGAAAEADLKGSVERIIAELADVNATVRERADLRLRNLPLPAYPIVTSIYAKEKENLDTEARARIESSIEMFKALAALDERAAAYWKWIRENALKAYDEDSDRNPKWDKEAREAIELATSWPRNEAQSARMKTLFARASAAGCEDPLFIYYHALFYRREPDADPRKTVEMLLAAKRGVTQRYPYPAWIKCMVAARSDAETQDRPDLEPEDDGTIPPITMSADYIFEKQIKPEDNVPDPLLFEMAESISKRSGLDGARYWYEKLSKAFEKYSPGSEYLLVLKGSCYTRHAQARDDFERRGVEWTPEERDRRLAVAQEALEKAYEADPKLLVVPTRMLDVLFLRDAEREEIDKWFKRAMAINPDSYSACYTMLKSLPAEQKLDFARQCLEGRNWRGRVAFIIMDAHELLARVSDDKIAYWLQPEVWKDLKKVYETQFELFPDSPYDRSYYAMLANRCHQWAEADKQFKILGEKPSLKVFGSMASYNYQRKKAAKNLAAAAAPAAAKEPEK